MKIAELLKEINPLYLENLQSESHHSMFIKEQNYKILIVRGLDISSSGLVYISKGIVINKQKEIFHYDQEESNLIKSDIGFSEILDFLNPIYSRNKTIIESYINEIDKLEDMLFERKSSRIFMDLWFDLKKDLSRIERHLHRNYNVIYEFYKTFTKEEDFQSSEFKELLDHIQSVQSNSSSQLSRLEALYNYYLSIKNDRLNKNIYLMTFLSAVFLPLNLVVGFFGMNTENLFFKDHPMGTKYVVFILIGALALAIFGLPLIRIIDNTIIRFFLGRNDMYKLISKKLDKLLKLD